MATATAEPQKQAYSSNIIFEWVDFLHSKKSKIGTYHRMLSRIKSSREEVYSLEPKSPYLDDTAYKKKFEEGRDYFVRHWLPIRKTYLDKFSELGFVEKYGSYKNSLREILNTWNGKVTDKSVVKGQLEACKEKYNQLQTDNVRLFLEEFNDGFFRSLDVVLKETFDEVLGNKYQSLTDELEPYLERFDADVIESIIDRQQLPQGAEKPIWRKQANAHVFRDYMKWELKDINRLFCFKNGRGQIIDKTTHNTKSKSKEPNSELLAILSRHIIK